MWSVSSREGFIRLSAVDKPAGKAKGGKQRGEERLSRNGRAGLVEGGLKKQGGGIGVTCEEEPENSGGEKGHEGIGAARVAQRDCRRHDGCLLRVGAGGRARASLEDVREFGKNLGSGGFRRKSVRAEGACCQEARAHTGGRSLAPFALLAPTLRM